jgi:hypothetical protein
MKVEKARRMRQQSGRFFILALIKRNVIVQLK